MQSHMLFLIVVLTRATQQKREDPQIESEFFARVYESTHMATIIVDSLSCANCLKQSEEILKILENSKLTKKLSIDYMLTDLEKIPSIKSHYKIDKDHEVLLFSKNQLIRMSEFSLTGNAKKDAKKLAELIEREFKRINQKVSSLKELNKHLEKHKTIIVNIAQSKEDQTMFQQLAESNVKDHFFHFKDQKLQAKFLKVFSGSKARADKRLICVVRHHSEVGEIDFQLECDKFEDLSGGQLFVDFGKFPKLRNKKLNEDILKLLYWKQQTALFLVIGKSPQHKAAFSEAVKVLPRRMIYTTTLIEDSEPTFLQMFMMSKQTPVPDSVYVAYAIPGGDVRVDKMEAPLTKENIVDFAFTFMKNNKWLFQYDFQTLEEKRRKEFREAQAKADSDL